MTDNSNTTAQAALDAVPDSVFERIKKILAVAEGVSTDSPEHRRAEAAAALAMAQKLLQAYNLDISAIAQHTSGNALGEVEDQKLQLHSVRQNKHESTPRLMRMDQDWLVIIAQAIARGSFCRVLTSKYTMWFVGRARNVQASMYMFTNIVGQVQELARLAVQANNQRLKAEHWVSDIHHVEGKNHPNVYRNSFILGAASTIQTRLNERRAEFEREHRNTTASAGNAARVVTGMEVVMAADNEVGDYMQEKWGWGSTRRTSTSTTVSTDTRSAEQKSKDEAEYQERRRKEREHEAKLDEAYYRRYGRSRSEANQPKRKQLNTSAYYSGVESGKRVSLDAGKVSDAERKQLGK